MRPSAAVGVRGGGMGGFATGAAGAYRAITRLLPTVERIAMGLIFLLSGANGLLDFLPRPSTPMPEGAAAFAGALVKTGYLFPLIMATQFLVGALLLSNRFVPLALALIAPIVVNIFLFHAVLAPTGMVLATLVVALEISLVRAHRDAYVPMLAAISRPRSS